jgi:hypothetical protein
MARVNRAIWVIAFVGLACGGTATVFDDDGAGGDGGSGATGAGGGVGANGGGGAGSAWDDCNGPGQCILAAATCCGVCGQATLADVVGVNQARTQAYQDAVCGDDPPPCPGCPTEIPGEFFAFCDAGKCRAADVREEPISECERSADCRLRWGLECCEGCFDQEPPYTGLVAVSIDGGNDLGGLVCGSDDLGCPECGAVYPEGAAAVCDGGHCQVVFANP